MDIPYKKILWVVFVLTWYSPCMMAQNTMTKKIEKTFTLTNSDELELVNKYGNINLYGWDKDEVSIAIDIAVKHKKKEYAESLLNRINPVIRASDNFVSVVFQIDEKSNGWFANFFEKANPFDYDRSNIQINYTIYMPNKARLNLTNTFGDAIIEDWTGKLNASLEHGDFWINEDLDNAKITMNYGKLRAQNIDFGVFDIKNGGVNMSNSKNLRINSSGTDMSLNTINSLEINSNKDEITIEEVGTMYGTLKFSTLLLNQLMGDINLTTKIADLRVNNIVDDVIEINIEQESSEINLNINEFSHRFTATLEQGLVRMPKTFDNIDSEMLDKGKKLRKIKATYGKSKQGIITINGRKGVVLLKEL